MPTLYNVSINFDGSMFYVKPINSDAVEPQFIRSKKMQLMTYDMATLALDDGYRMVREQNIFCGTNDDPHKSVMRNAVDVTPEPTNEFDKETPDYTDDDAPDEFDYDDDSDEGCYDYGDYGDDGDGRYDHN